ncbi:MAG: RluA family pseudouridine synthase [Prolixibacteraceae bacterium]|jgi:23S rRNA pseudouridine1911/1915/1917 synthase|nr:RluA family pseudouridine synthase [Prolixibacteraceae bacterium]
MKKKNSDFFNKSKKNSTQFTIQEEITLMDFLQLKYTDRSRASLKQMLHNELVKVNNEVITQYNYNLHQGSKVEITSVKPKKIKKVRGIEILFEDKSLIIINKPAGLSTMPFGNGSKDSVFSILTYYVKGKSKRHEIYNIHRIDKDVSGIMVWAKNEFIAEQVKEQWIATPPRRSYYAVIEGKFPQKEGKITSFMKDIKGKIVKSKQDVSYGKEVTTYYHVLDHKGSFSLVKMWAKHTFKHQFRVHAKELGAPILGDKVYEATRNNLKKLALHLGDIKMVHPQTNKPLEIKTEIPLDYRKLF